jgi:hypothetical protein
MLLERALHGVIPSEARNLSSMKTQEKKGFLGPAKPGLGMTSLGEIYETAPLLL